MIVTRTRFRWYRFLRSLKRAGPWKRWLHRSFAEAERIHLQVPPAKIALYAGGACLLVGALAFSFYQSWLAVPILIPVGVAWFVHSMREEKRKQIELGRSSFQDGMRSISAALSAGYSPENAVKEAAAELRHLYGDRDLVVREFRLMVQKLNMNRPVEAVLQEAAEDLGMEDLRSFAEVFGVAKRSGGQLVAIIADTVDVMEEKQQTQDEVATMLSGKQFEQQILTVFPLALIAYLNLSAGDFFQILYTTWMGRTVMTICLAVYLAAVVLSWKIGRIQV